jgi:hypothetical protein
MVAFFFLVGIMVMLQVAVGSHIHGNVKKTAAM